QRRADWSEEDRSELRSVEDLNDRVEFIIKRTLLAHKDENAAFDSLNRVFAARKPREIRNLLLIPHLAAFSRLAAQSAIGKERSGVSWTPAGQRDRSRIILSGPDGKKAEKLTEKELKIYAQAAVAVINLTGKWIDYLILKDEGLKKIGATFEQLNNNRRDVINTLRVSEYTRQYPKVKKFIEKYADGGAIRAGPADMISSRCSLQTSSRLPDISDLPLALREKFINSKKPGEPGGRLPRTAMIIGVAGLIGSAKTTVAAAIKIIGMEKVALINMDEIGHQVREEEDIKRSIVSFFGDDILGSSGSIDRRKLGRMVFSSEANRLRLNAIMYRGMNQRAVAAIEKALSEDHKLIVIEAAVLSEMRELYARCDEIWLVETKAGIRHERLRRGRGLTESRIRDIERLQMPALSQLARDRRTRVISNDGTVEELFARVEERMKALRLRDGGQLEKYFGMPGFQVEWEKCGLEDKNIIQAIFETGSIRDAAAQLGIADSLIRTRKSRVYKNVYPVIFAAIGERLKEKQNEGKPAEDDILELLRDLRDEDKRVSKSGFYSLLEKKFKGENRELDYSLRSVTNYLDGFLSGCADKGLIKVIKPKKSDMDSVKVERALLKGNNISDIAAEVGQKPGTLNKRIHRTPSLSLALEKGRLTDKKVMEFFITGKGSIEAARLVAARNGFKVKYSTFQSRVYSIIQSGKYPDFISDINRLISENAERKRAVGARSSKNAGVSHSKDEAEKLNAVMSSALGHNASPLTLENLTVIAQILLSQKKQEQKPQWIGLYELCRAAQAAGYGCSLNAAFITLADRLFRDHPEFRPRDQFPAEVFLKKDGGDDERLELNKKYRMYAAKHGFAPITSLRDLSLIYSPISGLIARKIIDNPQEAAQYCGQTEIESESARTASKVLIVSDGSAVLGFGNVGKLAFLPIAESKRSVSIWFSGVYYEIVIVDKNFELWREYSGLRREYARDETARPGLVEEFDHIQARISANIIEEIKVRKGRYGNIAVMLEDIAAPICFRVEDELNALGIPTIHDDQHGSAMGFVAGLLNAVKYLGKDLNRTKIVLMGAGAAGMACARIILKLRSESPGLALTVLDSRGRLTRRRNDLLPVEAAKLNLIEQLDPLGNEIDQPLEKALEGADVLITLAQPGAYHGREEILKAMNNGSAVFTLENPIGTFNARAIRVLQDQGVLSNIKVVAIGNFGMAEFQALNNVYGFAGIFRALADVSHWEKPLDRRILEAIDLKAAFALAGMVSEKERSEGRLLPHLFFDGYGLNTGIIGTVADVVADVLVSEGVTRDVLPEYTAWARAWHEEQARRLDEKSPVKDGGRTKFLIVDAQNDICHPAAVFNNSVTVSGVDRTARAIQRAAARILEVLEEARAYNIPVCFIQSVYRPGQFANVEPKWLNENDPEFVNPETGAPDPGWRIKIYNDMPVSGDAVIRKDAEYAFRHKGEDNGLDEWLGDARFVIVAGFTTDH
ncbi:MAG: dephospho-CoA kinase, partial [Candidatus Omnitrophota bacterium]